MRKVTAVLLPLVVVVVSGCGSSSSSPSTSSSSSSAASTPAPASTTAPSSTTSPAGVNPNAPETLPPGDIPDTIAYVPYAWPGHHLSLTTPEGWSRTNPSGAVVFTDKLNTIRVEERSAKGPLTSASARSSEVPKLASTTKGFRLQSVSTVSRPAGPAVRIAYLGYSKPNPVTGKFGVLAFERYDFVHKGQEVTLVLSSPQGSDNVDPWRKVTSSLRFAG